MSSNSGGGGSSQRDRNEPMNQRYSSLIYDSEVFLTKLREFKPQSLGCLEARRKSSSTLIFPNPQQACMGPPKCPRYPHNVKPTPGYWIECHGPGTGGAACSNQLEASGGVMLRFTSDTEKSLGAEFRSSPSNSKLDAGELNISVTDCGGTVRASNLSNLSSASGQHLPATPTADRILTCRLEQGSSLAERSSCLSSLEAAGSPSKSPEKQEASNMKRGQSFDRLYSSSAGQEAADELGAGEFELELTEQRREVATPQVSVEREDSTGTGRAVGQRGAGESRRRFSNKRTITRDDIDLHRPRRGTPNITITEPSFSQSTTSYQPALGWRPSLGSRRAQNAAEELKRNESASSDRSQGSPPASLPATAQSSSGQEPIKFQIQTFTSLEGGESQEASSEAALGRQESSDGETELSQLIGPLSPASNADEFKPFRQQHRPSVIREDSDLEAESEADLDRRRACSRRQSSQPEEQQFEGGQKSELKDKSYCGLSTTTFTKRPYQQAYQMAPASSASVEQFKDGSLELISFEEENYEKHYYGREHWNYFTKDELLGPVMLSLKQEVNNQRDHFHVLLRTVSYTLHGTIPASTICADRYDREAIVRELSEIAKLDPPLMLGQLPSTPDELLKLDHIFIKTELKVGVIYIKAGQAESEEAILGNREESTLFAEFLDLLGDRITLKGFDRYKGGLDTVHNLTGTESVYTMWRNIEIMFHVSTMLPHEENDPQKLQKKRHIGNDIVCVAFIESDDTLFWPGCIKSYFLHTFITVRTSPKPLKEGERRKYWVSCVCRNEVQYAFKPYLMEQDEFYKSDYFREWLLVKIVNGERASYSAPKFARMQDRTRSQLLEDIITNLANHLVTGQIPKPYRRGSWRPLGHVRASSPLEDSMRDYFEDYETLAKDFHNAFCGPSRSMLCDVVFRVKDKDGSYKLVHGVRAIMAIRSRTFLEMLYGFVPPGTAHSSLQNQTSLRAIELKALSGSESMSPGSGSGREEDQKKTLLAKRGSVGADSSRKIGEKERRQSMLPALSKSIAQKPNYLTVPNTGSGAGAGGSGTSGMIKNAFNRLVSGNWSGWSGNIKGYKGEPIHIKVDQNKTKVDLNSLAICKEIAKIDPEKLSQREFEVKEFDYETFQQTIEYIHNGQCKLSYETIPGLICAAEHYDLPDLLHACFHHANTYMKLSAAPKMMNALYQNCCFYVTAMQLLESIYEYIDPHGNDFFSRQEYLELNESVFTTLLSRKNLQVSELKKFQAMDGWTKHQITNKIQAKQLELLRQKSLEQQQQEKLLVDIDREQQSPRETTPPSSIPDDEFNTDYKNLMNRLNKGVNIKLDKISNEDLVKVVLPTKVFNNEKIFEVMADESRNEY